MSCLRISTVIIIDDDPIHHFLCKKMLLSINPSLKIIEFTSAEEGLLYIQKDCSGPSMLLLDINMPVMNGWDFLEQFNTLPDDMKSTVTIYMFSSSVDENDLEKAKSDNNLSGYISKPVARAELTVLLPHLEIKS